MSQSTSTETPMAIVQGEPLAALPEDLYIPPDALEVVLQAFEGPLDLLLYLIKRQNLDILDIPIADITQQYIHYITVMEAMSFELAAEYLVMASMLAELKSRMLLPRTELEEDEEDPRAELVRRLQEYEQFKIAAENLGERHRLERDLFLPVIDTPDIERPVEHPDIDMSHLLSAFQSVLARAALYTEHNVQRESLSVKARMQLILGQLAQDDYRPFEHFFTVEEGRAGVVVTLLAVLELVRDGIVELIQGEAFSQLHLRMYTAPVVEEGVTVEAV